MRILLLGAEMTLNGAAILLCRWAEHLRGQGHEVLVLPREAGPGPLLARYQAAGARIIEAREAYVDFRSLVICNTVLSADLLIQAAAFTRCLWWIHEGEIGASLLAADSRLRQAFASASGAIFPAAYLIDGVYRPFLVDVPRERLFVVPNGIDAPASAEVGRGDRADGAPIRIACIGTLCERKRQVDLVQAVEALPDLPLECLLVGQVTMLDEDLRRIVQARPDRFRMMGEISHEETLAVIAESDMLVHPSSNEAFPLSLLEAGIRGKPMVLANLPVYRGVWHHGLNCLMHEVGDVALLSHLIGIFARDAGLRARFGAAARTTAQAYGTQTMLAGLDRVVAQIAWPASSPS